MWGIASTARESCGADDQYTHLWVADGGDEVSSNIHCNDKLLFVQEDSV